MDTTSSFQYIYELTNTIENIGISIATFVIGGYLISTLAYGIIGGYISKLKNNSIFKGFILGVIFRLLGLIIVSILSSSKPESSFDSSRYL